MYLKGHNNWPQIAINVSHYRWLDPSGDFLTELPLLPAAVLKTYDQLLASTLLANGFIST